MIHFSPNLPHSSKVSTLSSSLSYFIQKHTLLFFLLLLTFSMTAGCATSLKPSSPSAVEAKNIRQELETLSALYQDKTTAFFSHISPSFKGPADFKEAIQHDFDTFAKIKMNIRITRIEITKEAILTGVYWEGIWEVPEKALPLRQSGNALFIFSTDAPRQLIEIRGESPFGVFQKG